MKHNNPIGFLLNNISSDDTTNLNITTKPFQLALIGTHNNPNGTQSFAVFTIKNGPNYGAQIAVSINTSIIAYRGLNIGAHKF